MLTASQLTRTAAIAATIASFGASSAMARPSDMPLHPSGPIVTAPQASSEQQWTAPRTDGSGIRPIPTTQRAAAPAAAAVPLTQADSSGRIAWLSAGAIVSIGILALLAASAVLSRRTPAHSFRTPQV